MATTIALPKNPRELVDAVRSIRQSGWKDRNRFLTRCQIAYHYLRGARRFQLLNPSEGQVLVGYETKHGTFKFVNHDIRNKYRIELGRFMRMSVAPHTERREWGLSAQRRAAMGQVVLDYETSFVDLPRKQMEFFEALLTFGTVGIGHWGVRGPKNRQVPDIDIIMPWELLPIPGGTMHESGRVGLMRHHMVPLAWVKQRSRRGGLPGGLTLPEGKTAAQKMRARDVPFGKSLGDLSDERGTDDWNVEPDHPIGSRGTGKNLQTIVPLTEVWLEGPGHTLARYIVIVGDHTAYDEDFAERRVVLPMPIAIARCIPDLGFYSDGFVSMLITGNHQAEGMLQNLFTNVKELDQWGTLLWPSSAGVWINEFKHSEGRPRYMIYEPDPTGAKATPETITPANTGDFPGRVAAMADQTQSKLAGQGPMMYGQPLGRVDSAAGEGFAFEVAQLVIAATAHEAANAWSQIFASMLANAKARMQPSEVLTVSNLNLDLAGVVFDQNGGVSLSDNALPDWWELKVDVKDRQPQPKEQVKQELLTLLGATDATGKPILDAVDFRLENHRLGLQMPVGNQKEFEGFRKAVYGALRLFNDGVTPGEVAVDVIFDDPELHLRILEGFASKLEVSFASREVQEEIAKVIKFLRTRLGKFPDQAPDMMMGPVAIEQTV